MTVTNLRTMLSRLEPCLVVEDDSIILLDIEYTLRQFGLNDVRTATTASKAEVIGDMPDIRLAILDYELGQFGNSLQLAETLSSRGVSIIFLTAHGSGFDLPPSLRHVPVLAKPFSTQMLAAILAEAGAGASIGTEKRLCG